MYNLTNAKLDIITNVQGNASITCDYFTLLISTVHRLIPDNYACLTLKGLDQGERRPLDFGRRGPPNPRTGRNLMRARFFGGCGPVCAVSTGRWAHYHAAAGICISTLNVHFISYIGSIILIGAHEPLIVFSD